VLSGCFPLKQTCRLPVEAMQNPEGSPLHLLKRIVGMRLTADA
jgi:hypothetical protein